MYVDFTPEQKKLAAELRAYFAKLITPQVLDEIRGSEGGGPEFRRVLRQLGKDGWLGVGWPKEYGGRALGALEQYIFAEEIQRTGFPLPFLTINSVAPTIMRAAPRLIRGVASVARTLRGSPATRQLVRTLPTVVRRTVASVARQTAAGQPVTPRSAVRTLARQTAGVLGSPRQAVQAYQRSRTLDGAYHGTTADTYAG